MVDLNHENILRTNIFQITVLDILLIIVYESRGYCENSNIQCMHAVNWMNVKVLMVTNDFKGRIIRAAFAIWPASVQRTGIAVHYHKSMRTS